MVTLNLLPKNYAINVNVQLTGWLIQVAEVKFNHNSQTVRNINLTSLLCHVNV